MSDARNEVVADGAPPLALDYAHSVTILVSLIANRLAASSARVFAERHGIGTTDWRVISTVAHYPGLSGKAIAQRTGIDSAAVSRTVRACTERGLLTSGVDERQANYQKIYLTDDGRTLHDTAIHTAFERERMLVAPFTEEQRGELVTMLQQLLVQTAHVAGATPDDPSRNPGS